LNQTFNQEEENLTRYLLGQLDKDAESRVEERYFTDNDYFEFLQIVESSLMEDYLEGKLTKAEKAAFEKNFLKSPRRKTQLEFARALSKKARAEGKVPKPLISQGRRSWLDFFGIKKIPVFIPLAVSLLLISGVAFILIQNQLLQSKQTQMAANSESDAKPAGNRSEPATSAPQLPPPSADKPAKLPEPEQIQPATKKSQPTITLDPQSRSTRGSGGMRRVEITPDAENLSIKLIFTSDDYKTFRVIVKDKTAKAIATRENLKAQSNRLGKQLALQLSAQQFKNGDYFVTVIGVNENGQNDEITEYAFRVIKN
jgi:hypothetical protein